VKNNGKPCVGDTEKTEECNNFPCPVDGIWKQWGSWEECSASCGGGIKTRKRECEGPFNGGLECAGDASEEATCGETLCPVDGVFKDWSPWGECSKSCGGGVQERTRECHGPFYGGAECDGDFKETQVCSTTACPIDGVWSKWSDWTDCSKTCAGGFTERSRTCEGPFYGGKDCDGKAKETKECNPTPCPIDGYWKDWGIWGECSKNCGGGEKKRTRECVGPQYGGVDCDSIGSGKHEEFESCNTNPCPIDGYWEDWGPWSECVNGEQIAVRICVDPQYGGENCLGEREKKQKC